MYGNGVKMHTAMTLIKSIDQKTLLSAAAGIVCFVVGAGAATRGTFARPIATATPQAIAATALGSASSGQGNLLAL